MVIYWKIKYRLNDPDRDSEFAGVKTAFVTKDTEKEAIDDILFNFRAMRPRIEGKPERFEMTDEEYENGY